MEYFKSVYSLIYFLFVINFDYLIFRSNRSYPSNLFKKLYFINFKFEIYQYDIKELGQNLTSNYIPNKFRDNIVLLVAGPYVKHMNFTLNSLKRLRKMHPVTKIIYSTDSFIDSKLSLKFNEFDITLKLNSSIKTDTDALIGNIRSQINNIIRGLDIIDDSNSLVVRIRSDQMMLNHDFIDNLMILYSLHNPLNDRILKLSDSSLFPNFYTSDKFMFCTYKMMYEYWNLDECQIQDAISNLKNSGNEYCPESILDVNYFKIKYGVFPTSRNDYIKLLARDYVIVDENTVGILWYKSNYNKLINNVVLSRDISYTRWLRINENYNNVE